MFAARRETASRTPAVPPTEEGKTPHRVTMPGSGDVAYVFTRSAKLKDAIFTPANVAFVDPDCGPCTEHHDVDSRTLDESGGDFDFHAAQKCAAMPYGDDKVVVFGLPDNEVDVVEALCKQFGARSAGIPVRREEPARAVKSAQAASTALSFVRPGGPATYGMCG